MHKANGSECMDYASTYCMSVCGWMDGCLLPKLLFNIIIIIIKAFFPETHHLLPFAACFLTMNPLSGCCTAGDEETVRENMYHVASSPPLDLSCTPCSLLLQLLHQAALHVCCISAFLFAIKTGIKGYCSTFFFFFSLLSFIKHRSHSLRIYTFFYYPPPLLFLRCWYNTL